jgi:two-component system, chemotaxis family, sensor kinase Cph1
VDGIIKNPEDKKLREKAEKLLSQKIKGLNIPPDVNELIHELEVHQIELEMQNDELIRTQLELQTSQNRYFELYNYAPTSYFTLNEKELIKDVNLAGAALLGVEKNNLINSAFIRFIAPDSQNKFFKLLKSVRGNSGSQKCEVNLLKDKKPISVILGINYRPDGAGRFKSFLITVADLTEIKKTEIKLKETLKNLADLVEERTRELLLANDYNRNLIETSLDPLVTIGKDGTITDVNISTEKVTGFLREELIGNDFADYFTNPEEAKKGYQQVFKEGKVKNYPLEIKNKDGSETPVLYNASVYKDEFGKVIGVFAAARDITEVKKAEKELKEYWESLEEQVKQRTEELAKSNADLKQFAYVASHDLREPLRMINSFLQLLERRYGNQLDDDAKEFIGFAVDGARRLDKMIMDLLEYSRIANQELILNEIYFEEIMNEVILNLNVLINENNAIITYENLPIIRADENLMILLFQNLISNAIKYRSNETPEIIVSAFKETDQHVICVKDNGIGIDPRHMERIFTIFQRLHSHQDYEGSGIGLSIVQRIVHQHGGEIWVESKPGKGSTFKFTIKN